MIVRKRIGRFWLQKPESPVPFFMDLNGRNRNAGSRQAGGAADAAAALSICVFEARGAAVFPAAPDSLPGELPDVWQVLVLPPSGGDGGRLPCQMPGLPRGAAGGDGPGSRQAPPILPRGWRPSRFTTARCRQCANCCRMRASGRSASPATPAPAVTSAPIRPPAAFRRSRRRAWRAMGSLSALWQSAPASRSRRSQG